MSQGLVADEQALVETLKTGRHGGAGLNVFENKPHVPLEFKQLPNVVLLPHVGSATVETRTAMGVLT